MISIVPKLFAAEFRRDVVAVARGRGRGGAQIAWDLGMSESCLARWLKIGDQGGDLAPSSSGYRERRRPRVAGALRAAFVRA
jgi:transposase